jgi:two-component system chemotaxis sensor kinase CheA
MEIDNDLLLKTFVTETEDGLAQMEQALLDLEFHPDDAELLNTVFRVVHSFKGNAAIFELKYAQEFAHALEDLLDRIRTHRLRFSPDIADVLLTSQDIMRKFAGQAASGKDSATPQSKNLLQKIQRLVEVSPARNRKKKQPPKPQAAEAPAAPLSEETSAEMAPVAASTLRVDVQKLDRLLDLTGEIAIARGRTTRLIEQKEQFSIEDLAEAHSVETALQAELQELVMKVRMVPVGPVFRQYLRIVRGLAKELGKDVGLEIEGGDVEVDTSVVEHLRDPLLHMIRNAMDHGIELPEQRRQAGKPPAGTIVLRARHEAGGISVEVQDDGVGLDREKILEAARKRGINADPAAMTDHEVCQLVFESGVSTTDQVSNLSGRGVGMDVVRRNVQSLRGSVSISGRPGIGTTVHLRFPLTLAIIDGFAVEVGGNTYVIPLDRVIECVELPKEEQAAGGSGVISLRGEPLPYLDLGQHFGCSGPRGGRRSLIVVRGESQRAGLAVDELHGETQTVIKPLGKIFEGLRWALGSAILGTGRVALILDVPNLLEEFCRDEIAVP